MIELSPPACRLLGVLVEKAQTTPSQYPLSLNGLVTGANQKNNREPVLRLTEDQVLHALDELRSKELIREVMLSGSRVQKYRHIARETLGVDTNELVVLAELLLRAPATVGEIRGRASRMHPLESIETTQAVLEHLIGRDEPLVRRLAPAPGSRAARYAQLLCPDAHPISSEVSPAAPATSPTTQSPSDSVSSRLTRLEAEVDALREAVRRLEASAGELESVPDSGSGGLGGIPSDRQ
ncbi:MAG: DUF480 domain-containing protein [Phycisphaerales bacterium]|nr:YceH family protein [Phycisphaerae bacterium]NNF44438.1 DUF480 domain-containing protein [Phycisphaerales bacterium]NNM26213.1 DUF480 domain-containing protein [Phycisphaerales bacterium]